MVLKSMLKRRIISTDFLILWSQEIKFGGKIIEVTKFSMHEFCGIIGSEAETIEKHDKIWGLSEEKSQFWISTTTPAWEIFEL